MAILSRVTSHGTFFVTSSTYMRRRLFEVSSQAELFLEALQHYRKQGHYKLHAFVVMPDHIHLLLTPVGITLERTLMFIKGGFSHRVHSKFPVWQRGFADRKVKDLEEFIERKNYIHHNPVRAGLCQRPEDYPYSSAYRQTDLRG